MVPDEIYRRRPLELIAFTIPSISIMCPDMFGIDWRRSPAPPLPPTPLTFAPSLAAGFRSYA